MKPALEGPPPTSMTPRRRSCRVAPPTTPPTPTTVAAPRTRVRSLTVDLRERGFGKLRLSSDEAEVVRQAGETAAKAFSTGLVRRIQRNGATKEIIEPLGPLHALDVLLREKAHEVLAEVGSSVGTGFAELTMPFDGEDDASFLSAMRCEWPLPPPYTLTSRAPFHAYPCPFTPWQTRPQQMRRRPPVAARSTRIAASSRSSLASRRPPVSKCMTVWSGPGCRRTPTRRRSSCSSVRRCTASIFPRWAGVGDLSRDSWTKYRDI